MKVALVLLSGLVFFMGISVSHAQSSDGDKRKTKITKCKDEKGVWHYGSSNLYKCADSSKITTLNERGVRLNQVDKVKTKQELAAEVEQKEQEKRILEQKKFEELERNRILTVYQSEEDIEKARATKMLSYDRKIDQHQRYIEALGNQEKSLNRKKNTTTNKVLKRKFTKEIEGIAPKAESSRKRIEELKKEKVQSNAKYDEDLAIFRKYKAK